MNTAKRPNIIIFNPDQMRADALHHLGNPASITPHMDAMAKEGVSFENAFCQNPVCTPSRCSFMSGWYPHVRGHRTMHNMMKRDEPVLLQQLKDSGYYVWMQNRNDLIPAEENRFDELADCILKNPVPPVRGVAGSARKDKDSGDYYSFYRGKLEPKELPLRDTDQMTVDGAVAFIRNWQADEKPLCMFIPLMYPHPPYQVEEPYYSAIVRANLPARRMQPDNWEEKASILKGIFEEQGLAEWPEERWNELRAVYLGMCMRVDAQLGQITEALKDAGMYDDSTIFVFSDHGDYTGDYGITEKSQNTFEDPLVRVPFLIKPAKGTPVKPGVRNQLVELVDFYATVQELTGFPLTHTQFGRSLLPVLADENAAHRIAVYAEGGRLDRETHCADVDMDKPLDTDNEYYPRLKQQVIGSPRHTKATMCRTLQYKYIKRLDERDEFYDLIHDADERHNRIDDPAFAPIIAEHKMRMLDWYQETCDSVPVKRDQRFNIEMLLEMQGVCLPPEKLEIVRAFAADKVLNSSTFKEVFALLATLG